VIRRVTDADEQAVRALWEEFETEVPEPPSLEPETWEEAWADLSRHAREGMAVLAEQDGDVVGYVFAARPEPNGRAHVSDVYVRPHARRRGLTKAMLREVVAGLGELGAARVTLDVVHGNAIAHAVWQRLGFETEQTLMGTDLQSLEQRLASDEDAASYGAAYVQSDDAAKVETVARRFVPRLGRSERTDVSGPSNGWVCVRDELCDRDPALLQRLAKELSYTTGSIVCALGVERGVAVRYALVERGAVVDEYLSIPELYGPLPPGDVIALGANPRVVSRLTGADPERVRQVARTASSPDELPPAEELRAAIVEVLGLE
jgi:ribosomal protein S18 acetylase RimI-like enzyme